MFYVILDLNYNLYKKKKLKILIRQMTEKSGKLTK